MVHLGRKKKNVFMGAQMTFITLIRRALLIFTKYFIKRRDAIHGGQTLYNQGAVGAWISARRIVAAWATATSGCWLPYRFGCRTGGYKASIYKAAIYSSTDCMQHLLDVGAWGCGVGAGARTTTFLLRRLKASSICFTSMV